MRNLSALFEQIALQFQGLQGRHPGLWPIVPRAALLLGIFSAVLAIAYGIYWRGQLETLDAGEQRELQLRAEYTEKLKQAVNLATLRKHKQQVLVYVHQLEKQLPSRAEMDALLSDINQAGVSRGLQFELFKPGQVVVREFYAELPISIRLVGAYHDLGGFTSDISNLARIVTLNNINLQANEKSGQLTLEAVAKTFRYLDQEEIEQGRREALKAKQGRNPAAAGAAKK